MQRRLLVILALAACAPCRADEASELVARLFAAKDVKPLLVARTQLLALGPLAREALERRIDPVGARERVTRPPAEEQAVIDALVEQLDSGEFPVREQATAGLLAKGLPAIPALHAALAHASLERRTRAHRIIEAIVPSDPGPGPLGGFHLVQAVLLLGWMDDPASIPSLRHVLETAPPEEAAAADVALRLILRGGPAVAPLAWRRNGAAARAAWGDFLVAHPAPAAVLGELVLAPPALGVEHHVFAHSRQEWLLDGRLEPAPGKDVRLVTEATESFTSTLRMRRELADDRRYEAHRFTHTEPAGDVSLDLSSKAMRVSLETDGTQEITPRLEDLRVDRLRVKQLLFSPGLLLHSALPSGTLRAGDAIDIPAASLKRLLALVTVRGRSIGMQSLEYTRLGRVRYLGCRDGIARIHVAMEWMFFVRGPMLGTLALSGVVDLDAQSGELLTYDLGGPLVALVQLQDADGIKAALVLCEHRYEVITCERERFTTVTPAVDALLAQLADPHSARDRIRAAKALRALGEPVRPALERVLRPDAVTIDDAVEVSARIDAALAATDEAERHRAFIAMLRQGPRSVREALLTRIERASGAEALALVRLVQRIAPPEHLAVEAALLLAAIGTDASIPPLRAALVWGTPALAAASDYALRAIVGEGPGVAADPLAPDRARLAAAWDALLAARAASTGPATTLEPRGAPEMELATRVRCRIAMRVGAGGAAGIAPGDVVVTSDAEGQFRRVPGYPTKIVGRLARYRDSVVVAEGRPPPLAIDDQAIELAESAPNVFTLRMGDTSLRKATPAILPLSLGWAELLPAGDYAVGAARPVASGLVDRLRGLLAIPPTHVAGLIDHAGRLRYLGRRDGRDRYALAVQMVVEVDRTIDRGALALAGVIEVDPERGLVLKVALSGPGWGWGDGEATLGWTEIAENCVPVQPR